MYQGYTSIEWTKLFAMHAVTKKKSWNTRIDITLVKPTVSLILVHIKLNND